MLDPSPEFAGRDLFVFVPRGLSEGGPRPAAKTQRSIKNEIFLIEGRTVYRPWQITTHSHGGSSRTRRGSTENIYLYQATSAPNREPDNSMSRGRDSSARCSNGELWTLEEFKFVVLFFVPGHVCQSVFKWMLSKSPRLWKFYFLYFWLVETTLKNRCLFIDLLLQDHNI